MMMLVVMMLTRLYKRDDPRNVFLTTSCTYSYTCTYTWILISSSISPHPDTLLATDRLARRETQGFGFCLSGPRPSSIILLTNPTPERTATVVHLWQQCSLVYAEVITNVPFTTKIYKVVVFSGSGGFAFWSRFSTASPNPRRMTNEWRAAYFIRSRTSIKAI